MENLVIETQNKLFICPYFRQEGGGQAGCQNVLIFYVFIMGGREGVQVNKTDVFKYTLFLWLPLSTYFLYFNSSVPSFKPLGVHKKFANSTNVNDDKNNNTNSRLTFKFLMVVLFILSIPKKLPQTSMFTNFITGNNYLLILSRLKFIIQSRPGNNCLINLLRKKGS